MKMTDGSSDTKIYKREQKIYYKPAPIDGF